MSNKAITWAYEQKLPPGLKFVLVTIADRVDAKKYQWFITLSDTAARTGMSRRRVVDAIQQLEAIGAISIRRGGPRQTNHYTVNVGAEIKELLRFPCETAEVPMGARNTLPFSPITHPSSVNTLGGTLRIPPIVRKNDIKNAHKEIQKDQYPLSNIQMEVDTEARTSTQRPAPAEAIKNMRAAPSPAEREIASEWPTWLEKNHAKRKGVDWTDVVDAIRAEHGLPEPGSDLAPWKKRFFAMCAAVAGGFPDRCQAGAYELDELSNDHCEEDVA